MTAKQILDELKPLGRESYKNLLFKNYGVKEPCFGVAIGELNARPSQKGASPGRPAFVTSVGES
jgi:hypothetical protein